jgi:hypothetical protein
MMRASSPIVALLFFVGSTGTAQDQPANPQPSKNLINDSSFEGTAPAGLPNGWSRWSAADGSRYRSEVVEGGPHWQEMP